MAVRPGVDDSLWNDGIRRAPRNDHGVLGFLVSRHSGADRLVSDAVCLAAGAELPVDAAVLRHAQTPMGPGGYPPAGRQCGHFDGKVVADGPHGVLVAGPVCGVAGLCHLSQCSYWGREQLDYPQRQERMNIQKKELYTVGLSRTLKCILSAAGLYATPASIVIHNSDLCCC